MRREATLVACMASLLALAPTPAHADDGAEVAFERGLARFQAGDFAGAIAPLAAAHAADPGEPDAELLLAIAYYRVDRREDARPLFLETARSRDPDTAATARLFLGLLAAARGASTEARAYYAEVARSPSSDLATSARQLLDGGAAERWWAVAVIRPEVDSNVPLLPGTALGGGAATPGGDADVSVLAAASVRPFAGSPLAFDEALSVRRQARLTDYDLLGNVAGATYPYVDADDRASIAYHLEASMLGGAPYAVGHVVDAAYRRALGDQLGAGARYTFAARDFAPDAYAGYSGVAHTGVAELSWGAPDQPHELAVGYVLAREGTADPALSVTAQGARAALRLTPWRGADLRVTASAMDRLYDAASMGRRDRQGHADAALLFDLSASLGVVVGGSWLRNASSDPAFDYTKWTAFAGLIAVISS